MKHNYLLSLVGPDAAALPPRRVPTLPARGHWEARQTAQDARGESFRPYRPIARRPWPGPAASRQPRAPDGPLDDRLDFFSGFANRFRARRIILYRPRQ